MTKHIIPTMVSHFRSIFDSSTILRRTMLLSLMVFVTFSSCDKQEDSIPASQEQEEPIFQGKWYRADYSWLRSDNFDTVQAHGAYMQLIERNPDTCAIVFNEVDGAQYAGQIDWCYPQCDPNTDNLFYSVSYLFNIEDDGSTLVLYNLNGALEKRISVTTINSTEIMLDGITYLKDKTNPSAMQPLPSGENWFYHTCDTQGVYYLGSSQFDIDNPIFEYRGSQLYVTYNPKIIDGVDGLYVVRPASDYSVLTPHPHGCIDLLPFPRVMYAIQQVDYNGVQQEAYVQSTGYNPNGVRKYAFDGCIEVSSLVLGDLDIGEYAFWGCSFKAIFLYTSNESIQEGVATACVNSFDNYTYEHTPLHIPVGTRAYLTAPWIHFNHIYDDLPNLQ